MKLKDKNIVNKIKELGAMLRDHWKGMKLKNKLALIGFILLVLALIIIPSVVKSGNSSGDENLVILSAQAETKSITKTVSASGVLEEQDGVDVELPEGVELLEYCVSNGQDVKTGDAVAKVDTVSVMATIIEYQEKIVELDQEIQSASWDQYSSSVISEGEGRVKAVYGEAGDDVRDVIRENGALAVISLDGLMAVKISDEGLSIGDVVTVTTDAGKEYDGRTESAHSGEAVITITDNGPKLGEHVTVTKDDQELGDGELYVHSALNATAVGGTISSVSIREENYVYAGTAIFWLQDVEDATEYNSLVSTRRKYEDELKVLFQIVQDGVVKAPADGCVSGIDTSVIGELSDNGDYQLILLNDQGTQDSQQASGPAVGTIESTTVISVPGMTEKITTDKLTIYRMGMTLETSSVTEADVGSTILINDVSKPTWGVIYSTSGGMDFSDEMDMSDFSSYSSYADTTTTEEEEEEEIEKTTIMTVVPQLELTAEMTIDEMDILSVSEGQEAEIHADALYGKTYTGIVSSINNVGTNSGGHTKYTVSITVPRSDNMLDGMNVTAVLKVGESEPVLTLPVEALSDEGSDTVVYLKYDKKKDELSSPVVVETGESDGETVEILSGLEEGDTVWYSYYMTASGRKLGV